MAPGTDSAALLLQALDLLPFGIVGCDEAGRLALGNRVIDTMVGGLRYGQSASEWARTYGLTDAVGHEFRRAGDIPLVRALLDAPVHSERMRQRCGDGTVVLVAHARQVRDDAGALRGAVGIFVPTVIFTAGRLAGGHGAGAAADRRAAHPLLIAAALELAQDVTGPARAPDDLLERVADYVREHQTDPFTLSQIAAELGYNPNHLTTLVRRHGGEPLMRMVLRIRLESARRLLELTDLPIAAVARGSGPWDAEYFARLFRQHYGCRPSAWRERVSSRRIVG